MGVTRPHVAHAVLAERQIEGHSEFDEADAYELNDPKHPDYLDRYL